MKSRASYERRLPIWLAVVCVLALQLIAPQSLPSRSPSANETRAEQTNTRDRVSVRAASRGTTSINFSDGRDVLAGYVGPDELKQALEANRARPLSLCSADFDKDGVFDLVSGYAGPASGIITLHRGNVDSMYPNSPEAKQRRSEGAFTESPFLGPAQVFSVPEAADFLAAGDFDADGDSDVLAARRGGDKLYLLAGDGRGGFEPAKEIQLPGRLTTLIAGEINRRDGLIDVVVGVTTDGGPKALVFEGPEGVLRAEPEIFALPAEAVSMALGQLDEDFASDLVIATGREMMIVHGRDRKLSLGKESQSEVRAAKINKQYFPSAIRSIAAGDFIGDHDPDIALLSDDKSLRVFSRSGAQAEQRSGKQKRSGPSWQARSAVNIPFASNIGDSASAIPLVTARVSSSPYDGLFVLDRAGHQIHVITGEMPAAGAEDIQSLAAFSRFHLGATFEADGEVVAALAMQINTDAISDLVVLRGNQVAPVLVPSMPGAVITVNSSDDTNVRDSVITLREAILLSNSELLKSALTAAEQLQVSGTPAPGLDEVRFNIPAAAQANNVDVSSSKMQLAEAYGNLPMSFEVNEGQHNSRVKFLAHGSGYNLFLTTNEAVLQLRSRDKRKAESQKYSRINPKSKIQNPKSVVVRLKLAKANPNPRVVGMDELPGRVNYFIGNDPSKWRSNVRTYAQVKYEQVYPGVDLVYYGNQGQLEYDFIVAPGADPNAIKLSYKGVKRLAVNKAGDLILHTAGGHIVQHKPVIYQELERGRQEVAGNYEVRRNQIGFRVDDYDHSKPLVIDPVLVYSTYLGGNGNDFGFSIAVDSAGNAYVTGESLSTNFPTANAFQANLVAGPDAFITKLSAGGATAPTAIYSTYLGGNASDYGLGIAVDGAGSAYVTGVSRSTNFPLSNALQAALAGSQDAFVTKLNTSGTALIYSTYLGGGGIEDGYGIAVDLAGNAYVTGHTDSTNFPTANSLQANSAGEDDVFISKLNAAGTALVYSTYLGGNVDDFGFGIAVDSAGNTYTTGYTRSTNFPTANPLQANNAGDSDAFITKLNAAGTALVYSTYLGGSGTAGDIGNGIAVDSSGNAYVTGSTGATNFPIANPLQANNAGHSDAFITKLNAAGTALVYSTYLGGSGGAGDIGRGIAVDSSGNAYVTGSTGSPDFPIANPLQANNAGQDDAFISKLNAAGTALVYSTYLGGNGLEIGWGIAVDSSGNAYVTGQTTSANFPTFKAFQANNAGSSDAFITKIEAFDSTQPDLTITKQHTGDFTIGTNGIYNFTVMNVGPVDTTGTITVTDTLPNGLGFVSGTGTGWNFSASGQTVTCTNNNVLAPNANTGFSLTVSVAQAAAPTVTNTATVATPGDTNSSNNSASDPTTVNVPCMQPINIGQTVNGALVTTSCRSPIRGNLYYADRYTFSGTAGQGVAISLSAGYDTYLYLVAPGNSVIASDDDGGGGTNSRIPAGTGFFALPTSGTYTIEATTLSINQTGPYTLTLTAGTPGCTYNIAPNGQSFNSGGGTGSITVTAGAGCNWTATSNANFINITSGASGSGNGTVNYSVTSNTDALGRSGTVTIAGQTFTVTQSAGAGCSYSINPTSKSFMASGGSSTVSVTAPAGCGWMAVSNDGFITITSGSSGSGNGTVSYNVDANATGNPRTGTMTIAGETFIVTQGTGNPNLRTITLVSPLPKVLEPIIIDGTTQPGFAGTPIIEINGANLSTIGGGNGLHITAGNSTIRGLVINRISSLNRDSCILLITNGNNVVEGCYLGTDASGTSGFTPSGASALAAGVSIRSSSGNRIGGTTFAARNLIAGVDGSGIIITQGATANLVQGNLIGTDVTANISLGFQRIGVYIQGASGNTVGGTAFGAGNLISGNLDYGVYMQDDARNNLVIGNIIGGNGLGTAAIPNGNAGVFIYNPTGPATPTLDNTVGGTTSAARNIISGNDPYGVVLGVGATGTFVQGNYIGPDISGGAALANTYGVTVTQATDTAIGGAVAGARNIISGNRLTGIQIGFLNNGQTGGTGTTVQGNFIGTNAAGSGDLGNGQDGIFVEVNSVIHTITDNRIAFNDSTGIRIPDNTSILGNPPLRIKMRSNLIYSNAILGIDLGPAGVTPNDARDPDTGANILQNFPALTSATTASSPGATATIRILGNLNSTPNTDFFVQFFSMADCTGINPVGNQQSLNFLPILFHTDASGNAPIDVVFENVTIVGNWVNARAQDPGGNTSEFSQCILLNSSGGCNYSIGSMGQSFPSGGGTGSVSVTAGEGCVWTAVSNDSFIIITGGSDSTASGTVSYRVDANTTTTDRTGAMTISGKPFTVTQSGTAAPCTFSVSPPGQNFSVSGGVGSFNVNTQGGCNWTAFTDAGWINTASTGTGSGQVIYFVEENTTGQRTGHITVEGQVYTVTQNGATTVCTYSVSPAFVSLPASGGAGSFTLTTQTGCAWNASADATWITVPDSGAGGGAINYTVGPNGGPPRTGHVFIEGQSFAIEQEASCSFTLGAPSVSFTASGGTGSVTVTAAGGCTWTATSNNRNLITITGGSIKTGTGTVNFTVAANSATTIRSGTIMIAGQIFAVLQGAAFLDVPVGHLFYEQIGKLSARGVTVGCGSGNFCPEATVSREQMAAFIIRALGEFNPPEPAMQRFGDVPPTDPFYRFIDRMAALQITLGCGGGNYCPTASVTREQMAAFIIRGIGEFAPPVPGSQRYNDVPSTNSFYNFIDRMGALGITSGCSVSPPLYCPGATVTRGQMAVFLVRAFNL
jgi:beta-propeller repeat-containing protein/BACON domain-containing protein/all-beta uncharacterized protein/S-layer family protein